MPGEARKVRPELVRMALRAVPKMKVNRTPWKCVPTAAGSLGFRRLATLSLLFFIGIARNPMPEQIVGAAQPARNRAQHFQDDTRVTRDEGEKILPRQHRQTRVLRHGRIGRAAMTVEHCHLAKEVAMTERSENHFTPIRVHNRDAN